jgi:hypothetical protein
MMVGITHTDCDEAWQMENLAIALGFSPQKQPPMQALNPLDTRSVAETLLMLTQKLYTPTTTSV